MWTVVFDFLRVLNHEAECFLARQEIRPRKSYNAQRNPEASTKARSEGAGSGPGSGNGRKGFIRAALQL